MRVTRDVAIPLAEIELRTSRSSGPGGQHANVTASRVEAVFDVAASPSLTRGAAPAGDGAGSARGVTAVAQDTRSQARNRELALERLRSRLAAALAVQRPRRPTRADAGARRSAGCRASASAAEVKRGAGARRPTTRARRRAPRRRHRAGGRPARAGACGVAAAARAWRRRPGCRPPVCRRRRAGGRRCGRGRGRGRRRGRRCPSSRSWCSRRRSSSLGRGGHADVGGRATGLARRPRRRRRRRSPRSGRSRRPAPPRGGGACRRIRPRGAAPARIARRVEAACGLVVQEREGSSHGRNVPAATSPEVRRSPASTGPARGAPRSPPALRGFSCQRVPARPRPLVSKRSPATIMKMWPLLA